MSKEKVCITCETVLVETKIDWNSFEMFVERTPVKMFNKRKTTLVPYVCTECGKTEWYATEPSKLME